MTALRVAMTLEQCWHRVPGGTAVAALGMAAALAEREDVAPVGVAAWHRAAPRREFRPPIPVRMVPLPRRLLYESWHRLRVPRVQRATGPVDVVHATALTIPPASAPLVVTVHDLAFLHEPDHFTRHGVRFFRRGVALARAEAALVLCPSRATLEDCVSHGFERERLRLVPLGVARRSASIDDVRRVRRRFGLDRSYVMWTGTIEPRKNLPRLIEAFRALGRADVDLVLVGPQGWNEEVERLVDGAANIRRLGFVGAADLDPLYRGATVFCFPSLREGFGFPVLEAMAQGVAVVTSRGTSTEELGGRTTFLIDPHDTGSIASALRRLLEDDELRTRLAAAGPGRAAEFSWARCGELLAAAYREAAG